jgi:hypothetical protein
MHGNIGTGGRLYLLFLPQRPSRDTGGEHTRNDKDCPQLGRIKATKSLKISREILRNSRAIPSSGSLVAMLCFHPANLQLPVPHSKIEKKSNETPSLLEQT